ncbi:unnamed protein product [Protopolystoma xenopodis]|uniref:Serine/threonine-protein phosphatase 4 regulatory subunit 3-like central domain-containing protein n=1 Tax=Protopolystoma xenopodis TaxID=117903 RepID=A0A3S5APR8_9PLAT|nr:unnamed protein product [Protopolystoma xenopodis]
MKEEFYHRYLVKNNLIEPVVELFISNGHRYNLVDSAIIEFFEYIRIENISQLIIHIVENFGDVLTRVTYVQTFLGLRKAYEHIHRGPRASFLSSPVCGQQPTLDMLPLHNHQTPVAVGSVASGLANSVSVSSGTGSTIAFSGIRSLSSVSSVVHSSTRESRGGLDAEEEQWFEQEEEEDEEEEEEDDEGGDSVGVNAAGEDANLAFSNADNSLSAFFERISAKQNSVSVASSVSKLSSLSSRSDEDEEDVELLNNALSSVSKVAPRKGLSKRLSTSGSNGKPSLLRQATPIAIRIKSTTQQLAAAAASKCIAFDEEEDDESEDPDDELSFEDDDEAPLHGLKQESRGNCLWNYSYTNIFSLQR